jgi:AmmeMemoRadiSam system protein B
VAERFYPGDPRELELAVRSYLEDARISCDADEPAPKALIVPHAGYIYSGPVAASAYVRCEAARGRIERVVLLGPAHRVPVRGLAAPGHEAFATPLGDVPLDRAALARALALPQVVELDRAHAHEHSLEVQLPFLQQVLGRFALAPLLVGDAEPGEVAELLEALWGGPETLVVVSSDLSHHLDYATALRRDRATTRAIGELRGEDLDFEDACGRIPIQGLLLEARRHGLQAQTLDLRSSGDTAGPRHSVVGYGAYAFH